ncbi:MAG: hypothetical protein AB7P02_25890 [Alphaproteobacteria bacterium]
MRRVDPMRIGEFIVIEHPGRRDVRQEFGHVLDLAILRQWPQVANAPCVALSYARRFLVDATADRYLARDRSGCSLPAYTGWQGANEFTREDTYRRFQAEVMPGLRTAGALTPIHVVLVRQADLGAYNQSQAQFPLQVRDDISLYLSLAAERFRLNVQGRAPQALPMTPADAQHLLAAMGNTRRTWMAIFMTIDGATWNYQDDAPVMTARHIHTRLFRDPDGRELLYDLGPAQGATPPAMAGAGPGGTGPGGSGPGGARTRMARIPTTPLLYRLAPQSFDNADMSRRVLQQIELEQGWLQNRNRERDGPPMFRPDEIANRVPSFIAQQLLPAYRERLSAAVADLPRQAMFTFVVGLDHIEYADGLVRNRNARRDSERPNRLLWLEVESGSRRQAVTTLGQRDVVQLPNLSGQMPAAPLPYSIRDGSHSVYLALDRRPWVPALAMDARQAEQQWLAPSCSEHVRFHLDQGLTQAAAREAVADCQRRREAFGRRQFRVQFDIALQDDPAIQERDVYLKASLLGARVYGTHGDLLLTLQPTDFPPAIDASVGYETPAQRQARQQQEREAQQQQRQAQQQQREAQRTAQAEAEERQRTQEREARAAQRAAFDIAGVRMGMAMAEAEQLVRASMPVGRVVAFARGAGGQHPYRDGRGFISADGAQYLFLHADPAGQRVVAVTRSVATRADPKTLGEELATKYGKPSEGGGYNMAWRTQMERNECSSVRTDDVTYGGALAIVEGPGAGQNAEPVLSEISARAAALEVHLGRDGPSDRPRWSTEKWPACGPTLVATIVADHRGFHRLTYAVFSLRDYARTWQPPASAPAPRL